MKFFQIQAVIVEERNDTVEVRIKNGFGEPLIRFDKNLIKEIPVAVESNDSDDGCL